MKVKLPKNINAPTNFTHDKEYLVTSRIGSIFMINDDDGNECGVIADNGDNDMSGCEFLGCKAKWIIVDESVSEDGKTFDITQHEWSDVIAEIEPESGHTLVIKSHGSWLSFDKDDVIAMARDRGVTAEDLK